jgi:integrase
VRKLVLAARAPYDMMIPIATHAGLRHNEILHLHIRDVAGDQLHVAAKAGWTPKTHEERSVPINRLLKLALESHIAGLNDTRPSAWLFPGRDGHLVAAVDPVRDAFKRAALYDPALKPGLHMLRRTFATQLLAAGADIETVRQLGGWKNLKTVQRYVTSADATKRW